MDKVSVLYTHFHQHDQSAPVWNVVPISSFDLPKSESAEDRRKMSIRCSVMFLTNAEVVLDAMLPFYIQHEFPNDPRRARVRAQRADGGDEETHHNANQFIKDLTPNTTRCARPASQPSC